MEANIMPTAPKPALRMGSIDQILFKLTRAEGSGEAYSTSLHASISASTLSNINTCMSETSWTIIIKFHLEHHWDGGLTALGFGLGRIRTLVSMATDSSHRVIMGKHRVIMGKIL